MKVWLSYSKADENAASKVREALRSSGVDVTTFDDTILPGDSLTEVTAREIATSDAVIIVLSNAAVESPWLLSEIAFSVSASIEDNSKRVIPVVIEQGVRLPAFLQDRLYIDLSSDEQYDVGVGRIVEALRSSRPLRKSGDLTTRYLEAQSESRVQTLFEVLQHRRDLARVFAVVYALMGVLTGIAVVVLVVFEVSGFDILAIALPFLAGVLLTIMAVIARSMVR